MLEVHKIQLPAVPADKESGKQIRSQIVASREVFRRMLELQRASFSGYDPEGEESMMQLRQRHQAIKDELDVLRGKAKLHGDDGGPEFKALCEQIHDLKCRQKESRSSMRQMQNREYGRFSQALAVQQKTIANDLLRIAVEHGVGKSQGAWLAKALFNAMRKNAKAEISKHGQVDPEQIRSLRTVGKDNLTLEAFLRSDDGRFRFQRSRPQDRNWLPASVAQGRVMRLQMRPGASESEMDAAMPAVELIVGMDRLLDAPLDGRCRIKEVALYRHSARRIVTLRLKILPPKVMTPQEEEEEMENEPIPDFVDHNRTTLDSFVHA